MSAAIAFGGAYQWFFPLACYRHEQRMAVVPSETIIKWRALSLKRLEYVAELQRTGRWRRLYASQDAFEEALRVAETDVAKWKTVACMLPEAAE